MLKGKNMFQLKSKYGMMLYDVYYGITDTDRWWHNTHTRNTYAQAPLTESIERATRVNIVKYGMRRWDSHCV